MQILAFMFSLLMGFMAGYFASHIAVNQLMHERKKLDKDIAEELVAANEEVKGLEEKVDELNGLLFNLNDIRKIDGETWNDNFANVKAFMKQQTMFNTQVNQALMVKEAFDHEQLAFGDDDVLYTNGQDTSDGASVA